MKFSRSLIGYDPASVTTELDLRQKENKQKEEEKTMAIEAVLKQREMLTIKLSALTSRLESARGSVSLMDKYQKYFSSNLLRKVQNDFEKKAMQILQEAKQFEREISQGILQLDNEIGVIKKEIQSVIRVIGDLLELNDFGETSRDKRIKDIDAAIITLARQAEYVEPLQDLTTTDEGLVLLPAVLLTDDNNELRHFELAKAALGNVVTLPLTHRQPTVMLAEDDEDTALMLQHILEREGFKVLFARDGHQASRMIEEVTPPDLVLLNVSLPCLDGHQLIRQIRGKPKWQDVPVIGLTVNYSERDIVEVLDSGANDCIKKPFNPRELIARIKRSCNCTESLSQVI